MILGRRKVIKRLHYPLEAMRVYVRWYTAYPFHFSSQLPAPSSQLPYFLC